MLSNNDRTLTVLEALLKNVNGCALSQLSTDLDIPKSAMHRLLTSMKDMGYIYQDALSQHYKLTLKVASMGLTYLSSRSITETFQPYLNQLAEESAELVRLGMIENENIIWIAKAQGSKSGLKYDPDSGSVAYLPASSCGLTYLSALKPSDFERIVAREGFEKAQQFGPNTPKNMDELKALVQASKDRGYGLIHDTYELGMTAMAKIIVNPFTGMPFGTVSIAGPSVRLNEQRVEALAPALLETADKISQIIHLAQL
ncbi:MULTISPECIES: IclR family transcriptional regulator [unclassified Acinetobacter]|uniref:IclR family transcriptional regulator n=1 Tax=unclassified Acinetobacter TaxID=196816 RepID=UPI002934BFC6|nr:MULTISPECIES: IclR family transcriptional regulator [unclassified Acinetobacter]WOE32232.1 IclR family transcriptional regulator [Acinetobacter sp. SAAs470]WOE37702.1 IclR family transcriptional regulator [Acinetobacter sp. SAAs474]